MDALLTAAETADVEIALVAANKPCSGLERAAAAGYNTALINRSDYDSKQAHEAALDAVLLQAAPDWIFLAGYMALLSAAFIARQNHKIINIHPLSCLPIKGSTPISEPLMMGRSFMVSPFILLQQAWMKAM
jgi:phosphoribosylglycinamide formyltransferase-1